MDLTLHSPVEGLTLELSGGVAVRLEHLLGSDTRVVALRTSSAVEEPSKKAIDMVGPHPNCCERKEE